MDDNTVMELDLAVKYIQSVLQNKDSLIKMNILNQGENGLARIVINTDDIPCLPPRPKPRMFLCPGVKQVQWCPKPTPHYFIIGNPSAVTLVTKHRLIKKAFRNLGYVLAQMEARGALHNWRQFATTSRPRQPTTTGTNHSVSLALHH
jgi:hypothetical protein